MCDRRMGAEASREGGLEEGIKDRRGDICIFVFYAVSEQKNLIYILRYLRKVNLILFIRIINDSSYFL